MTSSSAPLRPREPPFQDIVIEGVRPTGDGGLYPARRGRGDRVEIEATIYWASHDRLAADVQVEGPEGLRLRLPMTGVPGDRWQATLEVRHIGTYRFQIRAGPDPLRSQADAILRWMDAGENPEPEIEDLRQALAGPARRPRKDLAVLREVRQRLSTDPRAGVRDLLSRPDVARALTEARSRRHDRRSPWFRLEVDPPRAVFSAWYEFFPRSESSEPGRHGTFREAERRLEYAADLGFDVVYLPPIHPIGRTGRRGPNNEGPAGPGDPGSPWAVGAEEGGHTAVHPELGTLEDFRVFLRRARDLGLDVALDLAFQCSPDHPWVREHPEWFVHRHDGSIRYAENPPKRYPDIYPLDFSGPAWREVWTACREVVRFWCEQGVRLYRVDNPHTKPFSFWAWLLRSVRSEYPETVFLAEAFTRPAVMYHLAKIGFQQSYTYFTWRNTKEEIETYFSEITRPPLTDVFRPMLFTNTPDILSPFLQGGGPAAFAVRAVLATTLSPLWGIYSGFELCEGRARAGTEEYQNSEKYQLVHRDYGSSPHIRDLVRRLNLLRREHRALQTLGNLRFLPVDNPGLVAYARGDPAQPDPVFVVVNLTPDRMQEGFLEMPLGQYGLPSGGTYPVQDLLSGETYTWQGFRNYVKLDPSVRVAHVLVRGSG